VNALLAVLWKDLLTEWRSRDRLVAMAVFALLVVVVLFFAAPPGAGREAQGHLPGLLWVATVFASVIGLNRSFALELENEALAGLALAPADRGWIFLGKALASFVLLLAVTALTAAVFALAFGLALAAVALPFAAVAALGCAGLCSVGTLFAAVAVRTTYREVMLPLLLLPLLLPVLLGAVRATEGLLATGALPWPPLQLLLVTDGVFLIVSFLGFEYVLDE
jgi:heme exporter protein B